MNTLPLVPLIKNLRLVAVVFLMAYCVIGHTIVAFFMKQIIKLHVIIVISV